MGWRCGVVVIVVGRREERKEAEDDVNEVDKHEEGCWTITAARLHLFTEFGRRQRCQNGLPGLSSRHTSVRMRLRRAGRWTELISLTKVYVKAFRCVCVCVCVCVMTKCNNED